MTDYEKNRILEQKFEQPIKGELGKHFFVQDKVADREEGTDFLIFTVNNPTQIKIAARLRRYKQYIKDDYRNQFTIRWSLPSGNKTEIDKIRAGLVRYLFYGFIDKAEQKIIQYFIGNLYYFRYKEPKPIRIFDNIDGSSQGAAFRIKDLPSEFILHKYGMGTFDF